MLTVRLPKDQAARLRKAIDVCQDEQLNNGVPAGTSDPLNYYGDRMDYDVALNMLSILTRARPT